MSTQDNSLFFADGHLIDKDTIVIPAQFNAYPDADVSRVILRFAGKWVRNDCRSDMLRSVTYSQVLGKCYLAGPSGIIRSAGTLYQPFTLDNVKGTFDEIKIVDVEKYGELFRIRAIGESVYACGQSSQVYKLVQGQWVHMDDGILHDDAETLEDIDGTAEDDIYAVGLSGTVLHYDGRRWIPLDFPTNLHLSNVRCISKKEVYICGNNGTLFVGNQNQWQFIGETDFTANFWGMDQFNGSLYLSHSAGIMVYEGDTLSEVKVSIAKEKFSFYRIHANDGRLLSVGINDILIFDGEKWEEIIYPDNK